MNSVMYLQIPQREGNSFIISSKLNRTLCSIRIWYSSLRTEGLFSLDLAKAATAFSPRASCVFVVPVLLELL